MPFTGWCSALQSVALLLKAADSAAKVLQVQTFPLRTTYIHTVCLEQGHWPECPDVDKIWCAALSLKIRLRSYFLNFPIKQKLNWKIRQNSSFSITYLAVQFLAGKKRHFCVFFLLGQMDGPHFYVKYISSSPKCFLGSRARYIGQIARLSAALTFTESL